MEFKMCSSCGEEQPVENFYKRSKKYYRNPCKKCVNEKAKIWKQNNPEARKQIARKYYFTKGKSVQTQRSIESSIRHPERYLLGAARSRCRKYGIPFDLDIEDIVIPEVCPVFKTKFVRNTDFAASLDRIDPTYGYIKGNIQVLSRKANVMKSNASAEELIQFANWVLS